MMLRKHPFFRRRYQQVEGKIANLKEYSLPPFLHSLSTGDSRIRINYWQNPAGYLNLRPQLHGPYDFVVADFRFCDAQAEIEILAKTLKGRNWMLLAVLELQYYTRAYFCLSGCDKGSL